MSRKEDILAWLSLNKERIFAEYNLIKIGLFGSYARGEQHQNSDIDIIVEFKDNTENLYSKKQKLRSEIEATFNTPVDICREKYIKPFFKSQITSEALYA